MVIKSLFFVSSMHHKEDHRINRSGWLRAAVLGANDGIVSTESLIMGVAAADADRGYIVLAGIAGLTAGAVSMAAGEYVSVKSQADTEEADLKMEAWELENYPEEELAELVRIYQERGLDEELAKEVARQMTEHDALEAHARDEIGISDALSAQPMQAAIASAATFAVGAAVPLMIAAIAPLHQLLWLIPTVVVVMLGALGGSAAKAGGAPILRGAIRVCLWGSAAMGLTALVGHLFGVTL